VATGLRNPQELAFDQYGNLFTGDNNSDLGDLARFVYVVEGGDSGWRMGFQYLDEPPGRGPWNAERLWAPAWEGQAAYIVPPVANIADGPSGLAYYPGATRLPERYRDHFFLCDFRGEAGHSGIRSFALKARGASFDLVDREECVWSVLATDVDFGMDGALYLTDWVHGWDRPTKGRIYKVLDPARAADPQAASVRQLMAAGMSHRPVAEFARLLEHPDMRVRQEAQFALADHGAGAIATFAALAERAADQASPARLARLHAIWGLGQVGRTASEAYRRLLPLLADRDPEVRAQTARVLGDGRVASAFDALVTLLKDPEPRVRLFAALSLGKLGRVEAVGPVVEMLRGNADRDPFLRHAGVMALTASADASALRAATRDRSAAVRMGALLALRRRENPEVAQFLDDPEPRLVVEAARAIYDVPIPAALPRLAALIGRPGLAPPLLLRVLNAHFRLGRPENASALAAFAARADAPEALRAEALRQLGDWATPSGRDRVLGLWRPLAPRSPDAAVRAVRAAFAGILSGPDSVRQEGARLAGALGIKEAAPALVEMVREASRACATRVAALKSLHTLHDARLQRAVEAALNSAEPRLRTEGLRIFAGLRPADTVPRLEAALEHGDQRERQGALTILGTLHVPGVDPLLAQWLDRLAAGQVPPELRLDLLEAAERRSSPDLKRRLAGYEATRRKDDPLATYRDALAGGDAERGRRLFYHKTELSCPRCHKIGDTGGEVGPDLSHIGSREKREYLLESIVDPDRQIAKGFETVTLELKDGRVQAGVLKGEDAAYIHLMTPEGLTVTVPKDQIETRGRGKSAMPQDVVKYLSRSDVRDLVEFLTTLK
jgi:quinoprotein glucose dehydrogenase